MIPHPCRRNWRGTLRLARQHRPDQVSLDCQSRRRYGRRSRFCTRLTRRRISTRSFSILSDDDQDQVTPAKAAPEPGSADAQALVEGVYCPQPKIRHFNDPAVAYCRVCGLGMLQQTRNIQKGPRPPLGVLLLDDGMTFRLDADYVLGRDPGMDADVAAGRARPLRMVDPAGTISRLHLRVALFGWRVQVVDLGSANSGRPSSGRCRAAAPHAAPSRRDQAGIHD